MPAKRKTVVLSRTIRLSRNDTPRWEWGGGEGGRRVSDLSIPESRKIARPDRSSFPTSSQRGSSRSAEKPA